MRTSISSKSTFIRKAESEYEELLLQNEWRFLCALQDTGIAPYPLDHGKDYIETEHVVNNFQRHNDPDYIRTMAIRSMLILQKRNIIHSAPTKQNFVIDKGIPVLLNWGNARFAWENIGNGGLDATEFYYAIHSITDDYILGRWMSIRNRLNDLRGYGTVWELNTAHGDYAALAQSEGFIAMGFDYDKPSVSIAQARFERFGVQFYYRDALDVGRYDADIILFLRGWEVMVDKYGLNTATDHLKMLIDNAGVVYFSGNVGDEIQSTYDYLRKLSNKVSPITTYGHVGVVWEIKS